MAFRESTWTLGAACSKLLEQAFVMEKGAGARADFPQHLTLRLPSSRQLVGVHLFLSSWRREVPSLNPLYR